MNINPSQQLEDINEKLSLIPPDFDACRLHIDAQMMRDFTEMKEEDLTECICCGEVYNTPMYSTCEDPIKFANFGFGITLYYVLFKEVFKILIILLIPCIFGIIVMGTSGFSDGNETKSNTDKNSNITTTKTTEYDKIGGDDNDDSILNYISPSNLYENVFVAWMTILCFTYIIVFYIAWLKGIRSIRNLNTQLDSDHLTPSDYTVQLTGLPIESLDEDDFLLFLSRETANKTGKVPAQINRNVFVYDLKEFLGLSNNLAELRKSKAQIDTYRTAYSKHMDTQGIHITEQELANIYPPPRVSCFCIKKKELENYEQIVRDIDILEKEMEAYSNKEDLTRGNIAYITYTQSTASDEIVDGYKPTYLEKLFKKSELSYNGYPIIVSRAPEAEDILWENLNYGFVAKARRVLLTWVITLVILVICFFITGGITIYANNLRENSDDDDYVSTVTALTFLTAMVIVLMNKLLAIFISIFTKLEKHHTTTEYHISTAFKLALAMFINSALIPLFIHNGRDAIFTTGGLLWGVVLNWLSINFLQPIFEYLSPFYLMYLITKAQTFRDGEKSKLTQQEANIRVQPPQINMPKKYAEIILCMLYTAFYLPLFPLGILISILGIPVNYNLDKYLMLNRYRQSIRISGKIAIFSIASIYAFLVFLMVFNFILLLVLGNRDVNNTGYLIVMGLLPFILFLIIYPLKYKLRLMKRDNKLKGCTQWLYKQLVQEGEDRTSFENKFGHVPYDILSMGKKDYMFFNPMTKPRALLELFEKHIAEKGGTEADKDRLSQIRETMNTFGRRLPYSNMFMGTVGEDPRYRVNPMTSIVGGSGYGERNCNPYGRYNPYNIYNEYRGQRGYEENRKEGYYLQQKYRGAAYAVNSPPEAPPPPPSERALMPQAPNPGVSPQTVPPPREHQGYMGAPQIYPPTQYPPTQYPPTQFPPTCPPPPPGYAPNPYGALPPQPPLPMNYGGTPYPPPALQIDSRVQGDSNDPNAPIRHQDIHLVHISDTNDPAPPAYH